MAEFRRAAFIQSFCSPLWLDHAGQEEEKLNQSDTLFPAPYCVNWHCDHSSYTRAAALRQGEGEGTQGRLLALFLPSSPLLTTPMMGVSANVSIHTGLWSYCGFQHLWVHMLMWTVIYCTWLMSLSGFSGRLWVFNKVLNNYYYIFSLQMKSFNKCSTVLNSSWMNF